MDDSVVFVRTAKGRDQAVGNVRQQLAPQLRILLLLVDGKSTLGELQKRVSDKIPMGQLQATIDALLTYGYIELARSAAPADNYLDFTHLGSAEPGPQPTREQMADALEITLSGMPKLRKAGYYVNIFNRPTKRIPPRSGDKYEVLIIDNDQSAVLLFARTMILAGFGVRSAANREEIIAELNKLPLPDALTLDIALPRLNGMDLLARIHQHPQLAAIPIIVITSRLERQEVAAALARGASGYMTKPCKPEALRESVHAVLGLK